MDECDCREVGQGEEWSEGELEKLAGVFKALAHPARLRIVGMLKGGERCVCELHSGSGRDLSTVSGHLAVLRGAGVVESEQRGKNVFYRLACECVGEVIGCLRGGMACGGGDK